MTITQALIMAAGYATRMRPLTDNLPKPLLEIAGEPLLTHIINHLDAEKVTRIIVNGYHAIKTLKAYMDEIEKCYPHIEFILSEETELLETGGGAVQALQYLDHDHPFYMINGDAFWVNGEERSLKILSDQWNDKNHDILLLLQSCASMQMTDAVGDYDLYDGVATRALDKNGVMMFTGVRVCRPSILKNYKVEKFSFLKCMDDAQNQNRLGGVMHDGHWYHISTPIDLDDVNRVLL